MQIHPRSKVHAVTGGGSGIGAATVALLAQAGHTVVVLDRAEPAQPVAGATFIEVDVSDEDAVVGAFAQIRQQHGRLDGLVNSAGIESRRLVRGMDAAAWQRVMGVNVTGTMLCTREAAALMREGGEGGAVVNVASIAGKRMSYSGDAAYTASKAAVLGFTRHAAFELAADRIRVNAVCPGPTLTPMITRNLSAESIEAVAAVVPLGQWVKPEDVGHAIVFLLGDGAAMCTGTSLDVDGGVLISNGASHADYFRQRQ
ncbi:SDR family oxidoreductase [Ramlibacter henchirensis]|uniref:SDR family oxidoreductase n=1 Tax=Ramlibacter henchirensis TaxID=204072 RepID=A0A4Z0C504_9BURK|nr:SDR family NAD(P)-dependent oxidoreductase [Ramlibacter henchirensis]TFZ06024.1 SDR family oxidoreductase [Ramlibacter henchirensis]